MKNIDWKLLRKQKRDLLEIGLKQVSKEQLKSIDGVIHLINSIQDEAVKTISPKTIFGGES